MKFITRHLSEGEMRSYQDGGVAAAERARVQSHLESCPACRLKAEELQLRTQRVQDRFSLLDPEPGQLSPTPLPAARLRLAKRLEFEKENQSMKTTIFGRIPRLAWAALILIGVLSLALTFEPVRVLANNFLSLFRVEQIRVVQVDAGNLPNQLENSSQLENIMSNNVKVDVQGQTQTAATPEEAGALAGFPLRLPANPGGSQSFLVEPAANVSFTVNMELIRGVLKDIGREDIQLPDSLDGAVVKVEIPTSVTAMYGECKVTSASPEPGGPQVAVPAERGSKNCVTFSQIPSPAVSAPDNLDLAQIGQAYLQVLGMSEQEAASFAKNINWTTTFVVPLPRNYATYEEVDVNGATGTLVYEGPADRGHYSLVWIKDGVVYALTGWGDKGAALSIADSVQ